MEYEEFEEPDLDSDFIDEETEHRLYSVIFFGASSVNEACPPSAAQATVFSRNHKESPSDITFTHRDNQTLLPSNAIKQASSVNVSSFRDESCSDIEVFTSVDTEGVNISSTSDEDTAIDLYVEATSDDSTSSLCSFHHCTSDDVVLSVAGLSTSDSHTPDDYSAIVHQISTHDHNPNIWSIDFEDISSQRSGHRDSRYFNDTFNAICSNCKKRGHLSFNCRNSGPACILCGNEGHMKNECKNVYCYACLAPGHSKHSCTLRSRLKHSTCQRCGLQGHQSHLCTELWRQYKHTIKPGRPVQPPWNLSVSSRGCCNCGRRGHAVEDCKRKHFRSNFLGPSPRRCVRVYDQKDIYRKVKLHSVDKRRTKKLSTGTKVARAAAQRDGTAMHNSRKPHKQKLSSNFPNEVLAQDQVAKNTSMCGGVEPNVVSSDVNLAASSAKNRRRPSADGALFISLDSKSSVFAYRKETKSKSHAQHKGHHRICATTRSPFQWINERVATEEFNADESFRPALARSTRNPTSIEKKRKVSTKCSDGNISGARQTKRTKRSQATFTRKTKEKLDGSRVMTSSSRSDSLGNGMSASAVNAKVNEKRKKKKKRHMLRDTQPNSSTWLYHITKPANIESWNFSSTDATKQDSPQPKSKWKGALKEEN